MSQESWFLWDGGHLGEEWTTVQWTLDSRVADRQTALEKRRSPHKWRCSERAVREPHRHYVICNFITLETGNPSDAEILLPCIAENEYECHHSLVRLQPSASPQRNILFQLHINPSPAKCEPTQFSHLLSHFLSPLLESWGPVTRGRGLGTSEVVCAAFPAFLIVVSGGPHSGPREHIPENVSSHGARWAVRYSRLDTELREGTWARVVQKGSGGKEGLAKL